MTNSVLLLCPLLNGIWAVETFIFMYSESKILKSSARHLEYNNIDALLLLVCYDLTGNGLGWGRGRICLVGSVPSVDWGEQETETPRESPNLQPLNMHDELWICIMVCRIL